jgi:LPS export ABC transporter protein LptC
MSRARIGLIVLLVVIVGGILWGVLSPDRQAGSPEIAQAQRVSLVGYDAGGQKTWEMTAASGSMKGSTGSFSQVSIDFLGDGGPLHAKGETLAFADQQATLSGGVAVSRGSDYALSTAGITWNESQDALSAQTVSITVSSGHITARAFRYDLKTGHSELTGGIQATVDEPATYTVAGQTASETAGVVTVSGGVSISGQKADYTCERLEYAAKTKAVRLLGGVDGTLPQGEIHAGEVSLSSDGTTASGGVTLRLHGAFFGGKDGA